MLTHSIFGKDFQNLKEETSRRSQCLHFTVNCRALAFIVLSKNRTQNCATDRQLSDIHTNEIIYARFRRYVCISFVNFLLRKKYIAQLKNWKTYESFFHIPKVSMKCHFFIIFGKTVILYLNGLIGVKSLCLILSQQITKKGK